MIPQFLKPNFWFEHFENLDKEKDKDHIIFQVLNHGRFQDWRWLMGAYPTQDIAEAVRCSVATAWQRQSLNLWETILGVKARPNRFQGVTPPPGPWS